MQSVGGSHQENGHRYIKGKLLPLRMIFLVLPVLVFVLPVLVLGILPNPSRFLIVLLVLLPLLWVAFHSAQKGCSAGYVSTIMYR